jgi:hypothetical protein
MQTLQNPENRWTQLPLRKSGPTCDCEGTPGNTGHTLKVDVQRRQATKGTIRLLVLDACPCKQWSGKLAQKLFRDLLRTSNPNNTTLASAAPTPPTAPTMRKRGLNYLPTEQCTTTPPACWVYVPVSSSDG